ncbi:MAG: hypothetical protein ACI91B_000990 [Planctomycetota bacterium]|jgi:hypothetical protein
MKLVDPIIVAVACAAMLPVQCIGAQEKPPVARQFLHDEYRTVMFGNFKLLRDTGIWDELNGSALKLVVSMIEKELSFPLSRLDRITSTQRPLPEDGKDPAEQRSVEKIVTLEGNGDLGDPANGNDAQYEEKTVGGYRLLQGQWSGDSVVQLSPKLRVYGSTEQLQAVLDGKPRAGLPSADVLSFIAGKKNLLAYFIGDVKKHLQPRESLEAILPDAAWPEDDKPTHMCIRVLATGDEDDPHVMLEWAVRHGKDGAGLVATEKAVAAALQRVRELKEARIIRPWLKKVVHERDGTDAVWRVDLGRARRAMGLLGTLAPFMFFASTTEVQGRAQLPQAVIKEVPKPKKAEKKGPDTKKGETKEVPVTTGGGN